MKDEMLANAAASLLEAASETTAGTICSFVLAMIGNPEVMRKVSFRFRGFIWEAEQELVLLRRHKKSWIGLLGVNGYRRLRMRIDCRIFSRSLRRL